MRAKGGQKPAPKKLGSKKKHWAVRKMLTHGGNAIIARKRRGRIQIQFIRRSWKMHPNYGRGLWNIAGGGKNGGETGEAAAGREFKEETIHELKDHAVDALDDCWFLGSLLILSTNPELLKNLIHYDGIQYGFAVFNFFKNGRW